MCRRMFFVCVVLATTFFPASGVTEEGQRADEQPQSKPLVISPRTLGEVIASADYVTVDVGFVLQVYSQEQVSRSESFNAAYGRRKEEYLSKRKPLEDAKARSISDFPTNATVECRRASCSATMSTATGLSTVTNKKTYESYPHRTPLM